MLAFCLGGPLFLVSALLSGGGAARKSLGWIAIAAAMALPFFQPKEWLFLRTLQALMSIGAMIRGTDLLLHEGGLSVAARIAHAFSICDTFKLRRVAPTISWRLLARGLLFVPGALLGRVMAYDVAPKVAGAAGLSIRLFFGLVTLYCFTEVVYATLTSSYRAAGFEPPPLHRDPILARSVREFWGARWNRTVSAWLEERFFRPLARRRMPRLGMSLAFVVSALIHGYLTITALSWTWALLMTSFFLLQGVFALVEGPLGVARWRPLAGRAWAVVTIATTAPLIGEPLMRASEHFP